MAGQVARIVNFPVKENAVGMSMRQIGWEKRKRVKEATVATVTATAGFNLLLDSFNLLSLSLSLSLSLFLFLFSLLSSRMDIELG